MKRTAPDTTALKGVHQHDTVIAELTTTVATLTESLQILREEFADLRNSVHVSCDKLSQSTRDKMTASERKLDEVSRKVESRVETWAGNIEPRVCVLERDVPSLQTMMLRQMQGLELELRREAQRAALAIMHD